MKNLLLILAFVASMLAVKAQENKPTFGETVIWVESKYQSLSPDNWYIRVLDDGIYYTCDNNCSVQEQKGWKYVTDVTYYKTDKGEYAIRVPSGQGFSEHFSTGEPIQSAHTCLTFYVKKNTSEMDVQKLIKALKHIATLKGAKLIDDNLFGN
ncbi:hypothetical protein A9P82_00500 [Arachidicoccus ginsenosidimutans]|uniref:hypothetical protein n=1 Tax=Arachidicoccus sp. BS20 TaxID=1850526 RepID=UPI0007F1776B|nr:hypothetical protein [Arachidicoccus sp. BS20]ANI87928.1 hypothetical protein A9P82_00500 [Arachidicoccus sp. BS20]